MVWRSQEEPGAGRSTEAACGVRLDLFSSEAPLEENAIRWAESRLRQGPELCGRRGRCDFRGQCLTRKDNLAVQETCPRPSGRHLRPGGGRRGRSCSRRTPGLAVGRVSGGGTGPHGGDRPVRETLLPACRDFPRRPQAFTEPGEGTAGVGVSDGRTLRLRPRGGPRTSSPTCCHPVPLRGSGVGTEIPRDRNREARRALPPGPRCPSESLVQRGGRELVTEKPVLPVAWLEVGANVS